ncbi:MAG: endonuclease/exonuclease/phosphatase family protein [Paracoccaceae bacterium]
MRLATYNVEWFDALFDDEGALLDNGGWSRRYDVTRSQQIAALGTVFTALDADAIMVIEAPDGSRKRSAVRALENFAARFQLRARRVLIGYQNHTQQEIALLYDPDIVTALHDPQGKPTGKKGDTGAPRFDSTFRWDIDKDSAPQAVQFSKPPLEVALTLSTGKTLRLIGVHIKSKAPHGARGRAEVMRISIENRRKQLAQSIWLRNRVESHLDAGDSIIVMGDFNDGPGLDEYEKLFGRSSVEIVLGEANGPCLFDPNAKFALTRKLGAMPTTSRFYIPAQKRYLQALLDYIMVSPDIAKTAPHWRIWHPLDDPECFNTPELQQALLLASDHFPVTIDFDL